MRTQPTYWFAFAVLLVVTAENLAAQDIMGGTVKYQQTERYDFDSVFGDFDDPRVTEWAASLPKESQRVKVLYFSGNEALYEEDTAEQKPVSRKLQWAMARADYMKPPSTELQKVYYDFRDNEKIEQVEFMTRDFLIFEKLERKAWRLTNKSTRILNYMCLGADLEMGDQSITAWFTSEIPISTGPDKFYGLPGLILAVEVDGETAFLATSIDLTPPAGGVLVKPDEGRKVTRKKLQRIMEEKIKEYKKITGDDPELERIRR
ncbi:GLPGLI family protein [Candidatus Neomarinimicrobiota bacterium]